MSTTILIIGLLVFFAHFLSLQFSRTNIPDVLVLMILGIVIGPLLGVVAADDFGKIGSLIATIALVVILFESGTSLDLNVLGKSLATTGWLSFTCFILTFTVVGTVGYLTLDLGLLPAILLGVTVGGTSSAVVIPMVNEGKEIQPHNSNKTSPTRTRQSDFHRQNHDRHLATPAPMTRIGRVNAKNRHTLNPAHKPIRGEEEIFVTKRCVDRTRTPVQAAPTYPIRGRCPPAPEPLPPPTAEARARGRCAAAGLIHRDDPESSARCRHR